MRIVSLLPSATEVIARLGLTHALAAEMRRAVALRRGHPERLAA